MINLDGLEEFLIKESKINKDFIKDFFGIQKNKVYEKYKPFTIDLDDIAFWLDAKKGNLKNTLIKNYLNKFDYIIEIHDIDHKILLIPNQKQTMNGVTSNKISEQGGHNKELILLTSDCFKMLCMRSKTKKANKVRQYYIDLEKLIDQYKDLIINQQTKKIEILENDLKKEILPKDGYCYIYLEKDELGIEYYRLGQSGNLQKRFHNHNSSSAHNKIIAFKIKTDNIIHFESCLRGVMFDFRYKNNKDYYKLPTDKIKDAIKKCKNIVKDFKNHKIDNDKINNIEGGGSINIKKINNQIAKMFSYSCECVMWNMYDKPNKAFYNGKKITDGKFKETVLPKTYLDKLLIVAMHRFEENVEVINLGNEKYSYLKLFNLLYKYYNKEKLDIEIINKIPTDIDDYKTDAIKKYTSNKNVFRIDIIGSLCRFENIKLIDYNIYKLVLGS